MSVSRQQIVEHVNKTLIEEFEITEDLIQPEARLREDLELDSLDAVDMIVALEQGLHIRVDEEQAKLIRTIGDVYDFVERMAARPAAAAPSLSATPAAASVD